MRLFLELQVRSGLLPARLAALHSWQMAPWSPEGLPFLFRVLGAKQGGSQHPAKAITNKAVRSLFHSL